MISNKFSVLPGYGLGRGHKRAYITGGVGIVFARISIESDGTVRIVETPVLSPRHVEDPHGDFHLVEYTSSTIVVAFPAADRVVVAPTIDARYIQGSGRWARVVEWERIAHPVPEHDAARVVISSEGVRIVRR